MAELKQYVNLDPQKAAELNGLPAARAGKKVTLEATVNPAKSGVTVTFEIKRGTTNLEKPGKVKTKKVKTKDDGKATLELKVSENGGDVFEVSAYVKKDAPIVGDKYTVWRRLYYQMSRHDAGVLGAGRVGSIPAVDTLALDPVKTEFAARGNNIELVDDTGTDLIARAHHVLENGNVYVPTCHTGYVTTREPVATRIVLVHKIATSATNTIECTAARDNDYFNIAHKPWIDETKPLNDDWLVAAHWRPHGTTVPWAVAAPARFALTGPNSKTIGFDFVGVPGPVNEVDLRIEYRHPASGTNGINVDNLVCVAQHDAITAQRQQTMIHELGHVIGMVPAKQKTHYTGKGHSGPHCYTGIEARKKDDKYDDLPGTCVMFGERSDQRQSVFCDLCTPSVRTRPVRVPRVHW